MVWSKELQLCTRFSFITFAVKLYLKRMLSPYLQRVQRLYACNVFQINRS